MFHMLLVALSSISSQLLANGMSGGQKTTGPEVRHIPVPRHIPVGYVTYVELQLSLELTFTYMLPYTVHARYKHTSGRLVCMLLVRFDFGVNGCFGRPDHMPITRLCLYRVCLA